MRILHINSYYSTSRFYKGLFEQQALSGKDMKVIVPVPYQFNCKSFDYGDYTDIRKSFGQNDRAFFYVKHSKILNDIVCNYHLPDYQVIHAHSLFSNGYIAYKLHMMHKIPYIVAVRNTDVNIFFKRMLHMRKLGIDILHRANAVVFLSSPYEDYVINKFVPKDMQNEIISKSYVIPNGIDAFWLDNIQSRETKKPGDLIRILQVGDITKQKNALTTAKAVKQVIEAGQKAELNIVGRIKDRRIYEKLIKYPFMRYGGVQTKEQLLQTYRNNDIFVMPSLTETFGLVYAEAMSQGLPVIYSKGQGFDGQFEEGAVGYSVNSCSPNEINEKLKRILDDHPVISKRCTALSLRYNWKKITQEYQSVYQDILEDRSPAPEV